MTPIIEEYEVEENGEIQVKKVEIKRSEYDLDQYDDDGYAALMLD